MFVGRETYCLEIRSRDLGKTNELPKPTGIFVFVFVWMKQPNLDNIFLVGAFLRLYLRSAQRTRFLRDVKKE
jgi:hypothetical protein